MSRSHGRKEVCVGRDLTFKIDSEKGLGRVHKQARRLRRLERWMREDHLHGMRASVAIATGTLPDGRGWGLWHTEQGPSAEEGEMSEHHLEIIDRYRAWTRARGIRVGDDRLGNMILTKDGVVLIDCGAIRPRPSKVLSPTERANSEISGEQSS